MKKQDLVEDFPDRVSGIFCYSESYQNIPKLLFPKFLWHDHDDVDGHDNNDDDDEDGLPAHSHHDKNPPWWEFVSNEYGGNMPVTKSHHMHW